MSLSKAPHQTYRCCWFYILTFDLCFEFEKHLISTPLPVKHILTHMNTVFCWPVIKIIINRFIFSPYWQLLVIHPAQWTVFISRLLYLWCLTWAEAMRDYPNCKIVLKKDYGSDCMFFWCIYNCKKKENLTKIKMIPCFAFSPCPLFIIDFWSAALHLQLLISSQMF